MFMGIAERNVMDGQGTQQEPENTKKFVYKFMEEEMQILDPRDTIKFQRIHRVGKWKGRSVWPKKFMSGLRSWKAMVILTQFGKSLTDVYHVNNRIVLWLLKIPPG